MNRLFFLLLIFSCIACNNDGPPAEVISSKDVDPESIWFDYQVWGEEGNDSVTVKLQYRYEEGGPTISITEPAIVELDGKSLTDNHSKLMGPYYEMRFPVTTFTGKHTIRFVNNEGVEYKETFTFKPFSFDPGVITGKMPDITHILSPHGVRPGDLIRILLTDTSFANEDVDRTDTINKKGELTITEEDMKQLVKGPVQMELIKEEERPVRNGTFQGGRIRVSYGLRREFLLLSLYDNPNN